MIIRRWHAVLAVVFIALMINPVIFYLNQDMAKGEFFIGSATVILAMATFFLAFTEHTEGQYSREQVDRLAKEERMRLRLNEQLEGLYSPLLAELDKIENTKIYGSQLVKKELLMIFDKYKHILEFLGSDRLKDKIIRLYEMSSEVEMKFTRDDWDRYVNKLIEIIIEDTNSLMKKYEDLTI